MAPAIAEQLEPDALQTSHCSPYAVGLLLHSPWVSVSAAACSAVPEMLGVATIAGSAGAANALSPTGLPTPVGPS